jgi:hypothetical protein
MGESGGANVEIAKHLTEHHHSGGSAELPIVEILEAVLLAVVAIATAWSGYQASLWTGHQAKLYSEASKLRIQSQGAEAFANQERVYNAATVVEWLKAEAHGDKVLADIFEKRLLPEFRPAFLAWKKTDPLHNPDAPAGPQSMTEYRNAKTEAAVALDTQATKKFEEGSDAIQHSDQFVRVSVTLATVLLFIALSQRFKTRGVRIGLLATAMLMLGFQIHHIFALPWASSAAGEVHEKTDS